MATSGFAALDRIEGIEVESESSAELLELISDSVRLAAALAPKEPVARLAGRVAVRLASSSAMQAVTALMASVSAKCHLTLPPEDIEVKVDSSGHLIYRCFHSPAHEWDLGGAPRP